MRTLWIAAAAIALAVGALVLVLRGGDDASTADRPPPGDAAVRVPATTAPAGPRPAIPPGPRRAIAGDAGAGRRPAPGLEAANLDDAAVLDLDDELRAWARRTRAENAERLTEARAEIRERVTARVTEEVDAATERLRREISQARARGDRGRVQALESRLADFQTNRDTLIQERVDAIVAE